MFSSFSAGRCSIRSILLLNNKPTCFNRPLLAVKFKYQPRTLHHKYGYLFNFNKRSKKVYFKGNFAFVSYPIDIELKVINLAHGRSYPANMIIIEHTTIGFTQNVVTFSIQSNYPHQVIISIRTNDN